VVGGALLLAVNERIGMTAAREQPAA